MTSESLESPRPATEQLKTSPEIEKCQVKIVHLESGTPLSKEVKSKYKPPARPDPPRESEYIDDDRQKPLINLETLRQLLDLDEDDARDFSREMVWDYFTQAEEKFKEMDEDFLSRKFSELSSSGHFLKGSSAALGISRVQSTCEKIQHCGEKRDEKLDCFLSDEDATEIMERLLKNVRLQYKEAKEWLVDFFENNRELDDSDV